MLGLTEERVNFVKYTRATAKERGEALCLLPLRSLGYIRRYCVRM